MNSSIFYFIRVVVAVFLSCGFLATESFLFASVEPDSEFIIRLNRQPKNYLLEICHDEGLGQKCLFKQHIMSGTKSSPFALGEALRGMKGLAQVVKDISINNDGTIALEGTNKKDSDIAVRVETFGSVILNDFFACRLNMLAEIVENHLN